MYFGLFLVLVAEYIKNKHKRKRVERFFFVLVKIDIFSMFLFLLLCFYELRRQTWKINKVKVESL